MSHGFVNFMLRIEIIKAVLFVCDMNITESQLLASQLSDIPISRMLHFIYQH